MARYRLGSVLVALGVGASAVALAATATPANIAAALADKGRPQAEAARDAARKPGELLAWSGALKPGAKVADLIMGGGYFTRILSVAVGPQGHVWAYQPAEFIAFRSTYADSQNAVAAAYKNVTPLNMGIAGLDLPDGLDLVLTVQNYHDMHLARMPADGAAKVDAEVFKSLKPGGIFLVVDHVADAGSGLEAPNKLHRIDPAIVRQEAEAAGFKFAGESQLLRNPADPHTASVFDPAIRGKTDQFVLKFRKPG
ncbi:methyltransferase [Phenylobacterium hankyongense]|uniref:Methyltransferase n=1 Tax=Phenylobacterium hankyongense TaxID=1813876 RepID=A0A328AYF6_9CAUL|nr:class I SAM-dependent methyltransferase [Phenylobacterium hankyongense]RAK58726.1 methyltransferase [Phenylobacterium hankyongense]